MSDLGAIAIVRLDKEAGITSHDAVDRLRRIVGTRRVGHAGTLDPFATGLLLLAWGRATRLLPFLAHSSKTYSGTLQLGVVTDSGDTTGRVLERSDAGVDEASVREAAQAFIGTTRQRVPAISAVKQGGEPLYRRARRGETVTPPVRQVTIESLDVTAVDTARRTVEFTVTCSPGTFVRSLAHDWGLTLGTGGALAALRRTAIGPHEVLGAIPTVELLERPEGSIPEWNARLAEAGMTAEQALAFLPSLALDAAECEAIAYGHAPARARALEAGIPEGAEVLRLTGEAGKLLAIGSLAAPADAPYAPPSDEPMALRLVWAAASHSKVGEPSAD